MNTVFLQAAAADYSGDVGDGETEFQKLMRYCNGDEMAAHFVLCLGDLVQFGDDFVDGDAGDTVADRATMMSRMLTTLMVTLPQNAFYQQNLYSLSSVIFAGIAFWNVSCQWERGARTQRMYSFILRNWIQAVTTQVAYLTGGYEHAMAVALESTQRNLDKDPVFEEWCKEIDNAC